MCKAHTHPQSAHTEECTLARHRGCDGIAGALKRDEESIALGINLVSTMYAEHFSENAAVSVT